MVLSLVISLVVGLILGQMMIPLLRRAKFGQEIRLEGPKSHLKKQGTPTMGGIVFFFSVGIALLVSDALNEKLLFLLFTTFAFGFTGLLDDALKLLKHESEGLTPKQKLLFQFVVSILVAIWAVYGLGLSTSLWLPVVNISVPLGFIYFPFIVFLMLGATNACNLTDGLDGLLSSVSVVVFLGYFILGYLLSFSETMFFALAMIGCLVAFLYYNMHPAKVFMGDTGSFFIGGAVVGLAILSKTELLLIFMGMTFVIEAISDIIQVIYYKKTKKRFFKMAPIHHHYEALGYSENQVVVLFSTATLIFVLIGLGLLYFSNYDVILSLQGASYVQ